MCVMSLIFSNHRSSALKSYSWLIIFESMERLCVAEFDDSDENMLCGSTKLKWDGKRFEES
jgi:hypothetical protein